MLMQFGQFVDHDITLTPEFEEAECCAHPENEECFNIGVPCDETFFVGDVRRKGLRPRMGMGGGKLDPLPPLSIDFFRSANECRLFFLSVILHFL